MHSFNKILLVSALGGLAAAARLESPRHLRRAPASTNETEVGAEVLELAAMFQGKPFWEDWGSGSQSPKGTSEQEADEPEKKKEKKSARPLAPPTASENPKCDQVCTNGDEGVRTKCMFQCAKMQNKICGKKFSCNAGCGNNIKTIPEDPKCEKLCDHVRGKICYPLGWEAPKDSVSPHHDDQPPPSMEATVAPRVYKGSVMFCNLYPANYEFEILALKEQDAKDGDKLTNLGYKQCDRIPMQSFQSIGVRVKGNKMSAVSKPIGKIPSVMVFGQWAFGNHQIEFNRYFAKGSGAMLCNAYPAWKATDLGEEVLFLRGGHKGKKLANLRYKECVPTALTSGDVVAAQIRGQEAGEYKVVGNPKAIILGKAGESTALAFEAWTGKDEVSF